MAILRDTQRFLHFNLTHNGAGSEDNHYVDLAQLLSAANRRMYRQGMNYHVANIVFDDAQGDADIDVCTLPNTWYTQAAWKQGFDAWLRQQREASEATGVELGRWSDFKVYLQDAHRGDVDKASLIDVNGNAIPGGDWDMSTFKIPQDGGGLNEPTIHMLGTSSGTGPAFTRVGLICELNRVMERQAAYEDPVLDSDSDLSAYGYMFPAGNSEVIEHVIEDWQDQNDLPPYPIELTGAASSQSPWVARTCMIKGGGSTSSPVAAVGGFSAPCGLLFIETNSGTDENSIGVTIELVPGEYKGVHALPMRGGGY